MSFISSDHMSYCTLLFGRIHYHYCQLATEESKRYYRGYHGAGEAIPAEARRKASILRAIGHDIL